MKAGVAPGVTSRGVGSMPRRRNDIFPHKERFTLMPHWPNWVHMPLLSQYWKQEDYHNGFLLVKFCLLGTGDRNISYMQNLINPLSLVLGGLCLLFVVSACSPPRWLVSLWIRWLLVMACVWKIYGKSTCLAKTKQKQKTKNNWCFLKTINYSSVPERHLGLSWFIVPPDVWPCWYVVWFHSCSGIPAPSSRWLPEGNHGRQRPRTGREGYSLS